MKKNRIISLLAGSIMLTALSAIITHYAVTVSRGRVQWVFHTYAVMGKANDVLSTLKDLERKKQKFIVSGDSTYLMQYQQAATQLPATTDTLLQLAADNPEQTKLLQQAIFPLVHQAQKQLEADLGQNTHHRITIDSVQHLLSLFNTNEEVLLRSRLAQVDETHQRQILIRNICFLIIGIVSLLALLTIINKQRKNDELVRQLNHANESLEEKVASRTSELQKQNQTIEELNQKLRESLEEMESFYEALQIRNRKAEDTLKEIRDLYDNAPCGYHSLSPDGIIVRMNKTELRWLGYTAEEVIGKMPVEKILVPADYASYHDEFPEFKKTGFVRNKRHTFLRKDGGTFPVLLNATAMYDELGNFVMSRGTVVDISELYLVEQKLLTANQRLQQLNEEKNHFLGVAAHDLKSPLNSVLGLINLIRTNENNLSLQQHEYLSYMQQTCVNMQLLITNILDISRIEQGLHTTTLEAIDLNVFIQQQVLVFREMAKNKRININVEDHAPNTRINSDRSVLQRILENLVSNAIKFSAENKDIILRMVNTKCFIRIEVIDQGQGILSNEKPRLFQKFQRLSARPTKGESSTGLGLSIVKELVNILHGKIYVESEINKGSTFTVELPL